METSQLHPSVGGVLARSHPGDAIDLFTAPLYSIGGGSNVTRPTPPHRPRAAFSVSVAALAL